VIIVYLLTDWKIMNQQIFSNQALRLIIHDETGNLFFQSVEVYTPSGWQVISTGNEGQVFSTTLGSANALTLKADQSTDGSWTVILDGQGEGWSAREVITLETHACWLRRVQTYHFHQSAQVAVHPGLQVHATDKLRYTFPLWVHEKPLADCSAYRADAWWALPFPFHTWHSDSWVAFYGIDTNQSGGTLDFLACDQQRNAWMRVYLPQTTAQREDMESAWYQWPLQPVAMAVQSGESVTLTQIIGAKELAVGEEPLLEAERAVADILLISPWPETNLEHIAEGIADYYPRCQLWEPDALGPGRGWFLNMWVYTQSGDPQRKGPGGGYFDLGWGEGIAAELFTGIVRHWQRTQRSDLLPYVDEMTRSIPLFKRGTDTNALYFDRSDGQKFGDFFLGNRVWTHSAGHMGLYLAELYRATPNYPQPPTRQIWLDTARSIGDFYAEHQSSNGDLPDILDEHNQDANTRRRITGRLSVCGLWATLAHITENKMYLQRALDLARAAAPEIRDFAFFYGTMIDSLGTNVDVSDGESAYYILEGLSRLYEAAPQAWILELCQKVAAFAFCWTYFYNVPTAHDGITRGGQVCRMPDFPLVYPIGPAKAIDPLLRLHTATGDAFYKRMAQEMIHFIASYQWNDLTKPWHGGMIHAIEQHTGKHWGPAKGGQVDTGMATGNSLASIELWLRQKN
jgi:hypothetical protein